MKETIRSLWMPTAGMLTGARRVVTLLATMLLTMTAQTAWADSWTEAGGTGGTGTSEEPYFVNMPANDKKTVTIPEGVTSFKVYDDGGKEGNYSDNCKTGKLVLTAPTGYMLQLSGNIITQKNADMLIVHDTANMLIDCMSSSSDNVKTAIPTVLSSGQNMTIMFLSDGITNYAGLDLTVTVVNPNQEYGITVNTATGGTITASVEGANVTTAKPNDVVTLTATPESDKVLIGLSVKDDANEDVALTGNVGWYNNNQFSFTMPASVVTVTPAFTDKPAFTDNIENLYINMPVTGTLTANIPEGVTSFKVYDDGGKEGNYAGRCNGTLVLTAPTGYILKLSGNIITEKNYDVLTVLEGSDNTILINCMSSSSDNVTTAIPTVISSGQKMTIKFKSNASTNLAGLNLTVTVVNPNQEYGITVNTATGGTITASVEGAIVTTAKRKDVVTLTATPESDKVLIGLSVKDDANEDVALTGNACWYNNQISFTMPASVVTVTPAFTDNIENLYINMPVTGEVKANIPIAVTSFHVYDNGGKDGRYSNYCNGTLVLNAPEGYQLQLSGNIKIEANHDKLTVYDGSDNTSNRIINAVSSSEGGTETAIPTVTSSGRSLTLYFESDEDEIYSGLDLTVTLINPVRNIAITSSENGSMAAMVGEASVTQAKYNDVVTLTAVPASGYLLSGLSVTDANSNPVNVNWSIWANTATFTMPFSAVTVTPTFAKISDGLSINMPKTGSISGQIPSAVSVKVYDDGGVSGDYSNYCNGTLTLTAPENCVLELTGNIKILSNDYLSIYDGSGTNATPLLLEKHSDVVGMVVQTTDLGIITSSSRSMTLHFRSDNTNVATGLDLSVKAISQNADFGITITDAQNGVVTVEGNATTAKVNDEITLTATPEVGYALGGLSVVDGSNTAIATEWNVFENTAKFVMPGSAVTVTPVFVSTNPLSINIPAVGTVRATIPAGITSLKVYDNGGEGAAYTGCDGSLILTAPEGYWLEVKGSIEAENDDWLKVYTGTEMNSSNYLFELSGPNTNEPREITSHICDGRTVLLNFASSSNPNSYSGLNLTVSLTGRIENSGASNTITLTCNNQNGTTATLDGASEGGFSITGDMPVEKVILSRTFESGKKTTVCWPFAVSDTEAAALGKFYQFKSINGEGKIEMEEVTTGLEANTPYIYEPSSGKTEIEFGAKTLKAGGPKSVGSGFTFKGIDKRVKWTTDTSDPLYDATLAGELGKAYGFALKDITVGTTAYQKGQFVKLGSGANSRAFRAYLLSDGTWDGKQPAVSAARTRSAASSLPDVIDIVWIPAQSRTTGISTVGAASETDGWYSLDGRKLDGKPTKKGLYINNGKKVVIK